MVKVYIIAEIGSTHDGSIGNAIEMVKLWASLGADAAKFQDHRFEEVDQYQQHPNPRVWNETRADYYRRTEFAVWQWNILAAACKKQGVDFIVSPFSVEAAREQADRVTAFKVASGQVTNLELLRTLRELGKPVHLSTGMTTQREWLNAVEVLGPQLLASLMLCTSEYPCAPEHVGLNWFSELPMRDLWQLDVNVLPGDDDKDALRLGFSDHTMGYAASLAAITLGARVIERHVTPSRHLYGSDAAHSLEPDEFRRFVRDVRDLEVMLANPVDKDELVKTEAMQKMRSVFLAT